MTTPSDTPDLPPNVRRVLDLHVRHLPAGMVDELNGIAADMYLPMFDS